MFSLKDPSLLAFSERLAKNLHSVYGIDHVPCDTQMREVLDTVDPDLLRPTFTRIFQEASTGKALERFIFLHGSYLVSRDGTGYFSSETVHCRSCIVKKHKGTKEPTYHHHMLGTVICNPDHREVIPLCPEFITTQDGTKKNDCERNAGKRWVEAFRRDHPHLPVTILDDALGANAPNIETLTENNCHFILGIKPKGNKYLYDQMDRAQKKGESTVIERSDAEGVQHRFCFRNTVSLNASNQKIRVNVLLYEETKTIVSKIGRGKGKQRVEVRHWGWVTDHPITSENVWDIMRAGRTRWRIENETFNTLKNQGYNFGHNYGHGKNHLSAIFALLMMLAFLVDQIQQCCCPVFQAAWQKCGSKRELWEGLRSMFKLFLCDSMEAILRALSQEFPTPPLPAGP